MSARRSRAALGAVLAVLLAGCTTGSDPAARSPFPTPPSTLDTARPSSGAPSPSGSDRTDADEIGCENVLDPVEYDVLAESGLVFHPDARPIGEIAIDLLAAGALSCTWAAPESDVVLWVVRLVESDAEWEARRTRLLAEGWVETGGPVPETYRAPLDYVAVADPAVLRTDRATFYLSSPESATSLAEVE